MPEIFRLFGASEPNVDRTLLQRRARCEKAIVQATGMARRDDDARQTLSAEVEQMEAREPAPDKKADFAWMFNA